MGKIGLKGIKIQAHIGVSEEERLIGREFIVDVDAGFKIQKAGKSDSLNDTLNYEALLIIVHAEMKRKFHLMEAAAMAIGEAIIELYPEVLSLHIRIQKLRPFLKGETGSSFIEWSYPDDF